MDLWVEFRCCNISLVGVLTPNTLCLVILILFTNEGQARCRPVERLHRWSCRTRHAFPATPCLPGEKQSTSISSCPWSPVSWLCSHRMSHGERSLHPLVAREGTILIYIYILIDGHLATKNEFQGILEKFKANFSWKSSTDWTASCEKVWQNLQG